MDCTFCTMAISLLLCLYCVVQFQAISAEVVRFHRTFQRKWEDGFHHWRLRVSDFSGMALGYSILFVANLIYPLFGYKPIWRP